jgi:hypothetical protein
MDPIGASADWEWQPYRNSWVPIDGVPMPSVPGGSHWGGGLCEIRRPCPINPEYGLLWWLNTGRRQFSGVPESVYAARGAGSNVLVIDPDHDLVIVVRWIDKAHIDGLLGRLLAAVQ